MNTKISSLNQPLRNRHSALPSPALEAERFPHLIQPVYSQQGISSVEFDAYVAFIEQILRHLLPSDLIAALSANNDVKTIKEHFSAFFNDLPLLDWNDPEHAPCTLCATLLCPSDFTHGVGRYICDILTRWLVPGKFINICSVRSLNFRFTAYPMQHLFLHQLLLDIDSEQDLSILKSNRENLTKEVRLTISSVRHARSVVTVKKLSLQQKQALIEENLASVIDRPSKNLDNNVFDQMHHFFLHLSAEDKIKQIQNQFAPYLEQKPKVFDRDIFSEIKHAILLFGDRFTGLRTLRHISRLISYQYLFRKTLMRLILASPEERHLSLKLIKAEIPSSQTRSESKPVLGLLGAMNVLRENELFEERHVLEAILRCLPTARKIENSFVLDRRSHDPARIFYLEIEKVDDAPFSLQEIRGLKKHLPHELKESVENVLHPVLMPRNEEEIMRNIVLLSQQLKYTNDIPQVIISFDLQTDEFLQFIVILLRILRDEDPPLTTILANATDMKIEGIETKKVGLLRKRYPKEASVFKVSLNKTHFFRKDFTIDLFRARQAVSCELDRIFSGIRDFNGGILSKQQEVFTELQTLVQESPSHKDFLLENFFFSITPPLRQTLIRPPTLKTLFSLMQEAFKADYAKEAFFLKAEFESDQVLVMAASPYASLKEELFALIPKLKIPAAALSYTQVNTYGTYCIGYIYQNHEPELRNLFYATLQSCLQEWNARLKH